jgi:hypothetical protein
MHTESCGPAHTDAEQRLLARASKVLQSRGRIDIDECGVPIKIGIELSSAKIRSLRKGISVLHRIDGETAS